MPTQYPHHIHKLEIIKELGGQYNIINLQPRSITQQQAIELLKHLPSYRELAFYDYEDTHPYISDEYGWFVSVQSFKSNFVYQQGNHGRSSGWKEIALLDLSFYLLKNTNRLDSFLTIRDAIRRIEDEPDKYNIIYL